MTFLKRSGSVILFLLPLLFLPLISAAQNMTIPNAVTSDSLNFNKLDKNVLLFRNKQLTTVPNMPIYNPKIDAKIRIYRPTEDLVYNMPMFGNQESSNLRLKKFESDSLHFPYPKKSEE